MNEFLINLSKYSKRHNRSLLKFCDPLFRYLGANHFCYYKVTENGFYTTLSSHLAYSEFYFSEDLHLNCPFLRAPKYYQEGVILARNIPEEHFQESQSYSADKFNLSFVLGWIEKNEQGMQGYVIGAHPNNREIENLFLNELTLFQLFIRRFKESFKHLLVEMNDDLVDLKTPAGDAFWNNAMNFKMSKPTRSEFLEKMGYPSPAHLTFREKEILSLLRFGYPGSYLAKKLHVSSRTIETHIINLRDKFNCTHKYELNQIAQELSSLGYFE